MRNLAPHSACLVILAAFALSLAPIRLAQAGQGHLITVAANDGYGLQDCLGEAGECGQAVADAWCAAEGRGAALSFGRAQNAKAAYVVNCGD